MIPHLPHHLQFYTRYHTHTHTSIYIHYHTHLYTQGCTDQALVRRLGVARRRMVHCRMPCPVHAQHHIRCSIPRPHHPAPQAKFKLTPRGESTLHATPTVLAEAREGVRQRAKDAPRLQSTAATARRHHLHLPNHVSAQMLSSPVVLSLPSHHAR